MKKCFEFYLYPETDDYGSVQKLGFCLESNVLDDDPSAKHEVDWFYAVQDGYYVRLYLNSIHDAVAYFSSLSARCDALIKMEYVVRGKKEMILFTRHGGIISMHAPVLRYVEVDSGMQSDFLDSLDRKV